MSNFVASVHLQMAAAGDAPEAAFEFGPYGIRFHLTPERPWVKVDKFGEAVDAYGLDSAFVGVWERGFTLTVVASEGRVAAAIGETPVLLLDNMEPAPGGMRIAAHDLVLIVDDFALWDLTPPPLAAFDREAARAFGGGIRDKLERTPPAVEEAFDAIGDAWAREGAPATRRGRLGCAATMPGRSSCQRRCASSACRLT
ncbi:MAG: hypothetical protein M5R40_09685 [Anaerolineae bacterium]|nr:hypothetical protein [Anaerolineae bacterium]